MPASARGVLGSDLRGRGEKEKAPEMSVEIRLCQGRRRKRCKEQSLLENWMLGKARRVKREKRPSNGSQRRKLKALREASTCR